MERFQYLGGREWVQSAFDAIAVQTVTLLAMHIKGAKNSAKIVSVPLSLKVWKPLYYLKIK